MERSTYVLLGFEAYGVEEYLPEGMTINWEGLSGKARFRFAV